MTEVFGAIAKQMTGAAAAAEEAAGVAAGSGQGRGAALVSAARDEGPVLSVSAELTALFGEGGGVAGARARLTQAEALRKLGAYCSRNKLRDTVDRRQVRCDVALARVLGCASFTVYEAKALLARHMSSAAPSRAAGGSEGGGGSGGSDGGGSSSGSTAFRPGTSASDAGPSAAPYQPPPVTAATDARADGGAAGAAAQLEVARLRRAVRAPRGRSWCRARDKPTPNHVSGLTLALAVAVACPWSGARGQGGATRAAAGGGGQQRAAQQPVDSLVPQLAALASWGGLSRLPAALRTRNEPLSRSGPDGRLPCGRAARSKSPIPRRAQHPGDASSSRRTMRSRPRWLVPRRWRGGRPRRRARRCARARRASDRRRRRRRRRRRARRRRPRRRQKRRKRRLWRSPPSAASWVPPPPTRSCGGDCVPRTAACRPPPTPSLKPHRPLVRQGVVGRRGVVGRQEGRGRVVRRAAPRVRASCGPPSRAGGAACVSRPRARTPSCRVATSVSAQRAARSSARRRHATRAVRSASCRPRASCAYSARSNEATAQSAPPD